MKLTKYKFAGAFSFEANLQENESFEGGKASMIVGLKEEVLCMLEHDLFIPVVDTDGEFSMNVKKVKVKLKEIK